MQCASRSEDGVHRSRAPCASSTGYTELSMGSILYRGGRQGFLSPSRLLICLIAGLALIVEDQRRYTELLVETVIPPARGI